MDIYVFLATLSLIVQAVILVLLITGYILKKKLKLRQHGLLMAAAVIIHLILVLAVMIPSFSAIFFSATGLSIMLKIIILLHAVFGTSALALGIWIVYSWRLRLSLKNCFLKKRFMKLIFALWVAALLMGFIIYSSFYL
jgi:hypothetical protein